MPNGIIPFGIIPFSTTTREREDAREHDHFTFAIKQLTAQQTRVLRTIAEHGGREIFSGAFLDAAQVFNAASVKNAVAKLERENIIYNYGGEYRFASPFFSEWLLRR